MITVSNRKMKISSIIAVGAIKNRIVHKKGILGDDIKLVLGEWKCISDGRMKLNRNIDLLPRYYSSELSYTDSRCCQE